MKKRIFKDWVSYTLIVLQVINFVIVTGESNAPLSIEFAVKAPFFCMLIINHVLIARHTNFYTNGF